MDAITNQFSWQGLRVGRKTNERFAARAVRLYDREQGESFSSPLLGLWVRWLTCIAVTDTDASYDM